MCVCARVLRYVNTKFKKNIFRIYPLNSLLGVVSLFNQPSWVILILTLSILEKSRGTI